MYFEWLTAISAFILLVYGLKGCNTPSPKKWKRREREKIYIALVKIGMLEIPLDKEFIANCLLEAPTKL